MIRNMEKLLVRALAAALTICGTCRLASAGLIESLVETKLTASDAAAYDEFGFSVAISGDTAVVGAFGNDDAGAMSGSAYIFQRQGTNWVQQAKLIASDAAARDYFGSRVAISGDTAVVGAYGSDDAGDWTGSAYIFQGSGASWTEQAKLTASDAAAPDEFGHSVAISGDTAVVGACMDNVGRGAAYIFQRHGSSWAEQAKLTPAGGGRPTTFGTSVAISGDTAIAGAFDNDGYGSAYIFQRDGSSWTQQAKVIASDGAPYDLFGTSVGISGDAAIVGANNAQSAYIFQRNGSSWTEQTKLTASDGVGNDQFGSSVAISGDIAIVGASRDDDHGLYTGSAYIFTRSGSSWTRQTKLTASDAATGDVFGVSVAISGDTAIVGAYQDDDHGNQSGSAYIYHPVPEPSCLVLAIAGLPGLLAYVWRRRRH